MRRQAVLLGGAVAVLALLTAAPLPDQALRTLADSGGRDAAGSLAALTEPLVAAVALLGWTLAAWLLATALLTGGSRLPGLPGRASRSALTRIAPGAVRRAVAGALGLGIVVGGMGAGPASASAVRVPVSSSAAVAGPSLDWPDSPSAEVGSTPDHTVPDRPSPDTVVVRPGDTLWGLAEQALPEGATDTEVAQAWPSWWAANRQVIGDDPDLLHPGQHLQPPVSPQDDGTGRTTATAGSPPAGP